MDIKDIRKFIDEQFQEVTKPCGNPRILMERVLQAKFKIFDFLSKKSSCEPQQESDSVNHPSHYTTNLPIMVVQCDKCGSIIERGIECIDVIRNMPSWKGNSIKYQWRAGLKKDAALEDIDKEIEDLEKSQWYIRDRVRQLKIKKLKNGNHNNKQ